MLISNASTLHFEKSQDLTPKNPNIEQKFPRSLYELKMYKKKSMTMYDTQAIRKNAENISVATRTGYFLSRITVCLNLKVYSNNVNFLTAAVVSVVQYKPIANGIFPH